MPVEFHQIAEHDCDVAALAGGFRRRWGGRSHGRLRLQRPRHRNRSFGDRCVFELGNRRQHLSSIAEQDADLLKVLVGQVAKDRDIDSVLGKTLGVLGHAEVFEPVRNLLHCGAPSGRTSRCSVGRYPRNALT